MISVVVGESDGTSRAKHQVLVHGRLLFATPDENRLMRTIVRIIGNLVGRQPPAALPIRAFVVLGPDDSLSLVDSRLRNDFRRLEPGLQRTGSRIIDLTEAWIDTEDQLCVLPDSAGLLDVDLARFNERWPSGADDFDLRGGSRKVKELIYCGHSDVPSPAAALAEMVPLLHDQTNRVKASDVEALWRLASSVPCHAVHYGDRSGLRQLVD